MTKGVLFSSHHLSLITHHFPEYFSMIAESFRVVASGQRSGAVNIAFLSAEPHEHVGSDAASLWTASRMMTWALRTFLLRYSTTVSTETASCSSCQQS